MRRTHVQPHPTVRGCRSCHRGRHPRAHPQHGRGRCNHRCRAGPDHRRGHDRGIRAAGGVRRPAVAVAGVGDRGYRWPRCWVRGAWPAARRLWRARPSPTGPAQQRREVRSTGRDQGAREALSRTRLGTPRGSGDRQALSVPPPARRFAVEAGAVAQRQAQDRRGHAAARSWDTETTTTVTVLRALARRALGLAEEASVHERAILAIVPAWRPDLLDQPGVGPIVAATGLCARSHPDRIHSEADFANAGRRRPYPG